MTRPVIPIQNVYFLFCYAWDRFEQASAIGVGGSDSPDLANLLARVLVATTQALLRRGLDRGYQSQVEELGTVRGRIEFGATLLLRARRAPRLAVQFDDLTADVHHNRVLKASLLRLARTRNVAPDLRHELIGLARRLDQVSDVVVRRSDFDKIRLHRNNSYYGLALKVAELAFDCQLPEVDGSGFSFMDVLRDERKMARVFEDFLRNFYRLEQSVLRVAPLQMEWDAVPVRVSAGDRLPTMRTDVFLTSPSRQIIVDAKYYSEALQSHLGAESFRSGNLYQLFAYLRNAAQRDPKLSSVEGMLIYPESGRTIDAVYDVHGHRVRLATVDLSLPWRQISHNLLGLLHPVTV